MKQYKNFSYRWDETKKQWLVRYPSGYKFFSFAKDEAGIKAVIDEIISCKPGQ